MKSEIEILTVLRSADSTFQFSKNISSMIDEWSANSLKVTRKVLTGKPADAILEMASDYGLTVCSSSKKRKRNRLGKVTKKVLCRQFNVLVLR